MPDTHRRLRAGLLALAASLALMVVGAAPAAAAEQSVAAPAVVDQSTSAQIMSAPTANASCERLSQFEAICFVSYSSATPVTIKWFFDGVHSPWYDNSSFAHPPCDGGGNFIDVQAIVSNAHGSVSAFSFIRCGHF